LNEMELSSSFPSCTWERHIAQSWVLRPYHHYAQSI
jgi:hypothetical protein